MNIDEKLEILKKADVSQDALCDAMHDLGEEGTSALHPYVAPFLTSPRPHVNELRDDTENQYVRQAAYQALLEVWASDCAELREYNRSVSSLGRDQLRLFHLAKEASNRGDEDAASALLTEARNQRGDWKRRVDWKRVDAIDQEVI